MIWILGFFHPLGPHFFLGESGSIRTGTIAPNSARVKLRVIVSTRISIAFYADHGEDTNTLIGIAKRVIFGIGTNGRNRFKINNDE